MTPRTRLGQFLAGDVDCYIDIPGPLSLDARHVLSDANKAVLREAIGRIDVPDDATVRLHVHVQKPEDSDTFYDLPQVKKDSEFHRDAVDFLRWLGFDQVTIGVDIRSSTTFLGTNEPQNFTPDNGRICAGFGTFVRFHPI